MPGNCTLSVASSGAKLRSALYASKGLTDSQVADIRVPSRGTSRAFLQFKHLDFAEEFMRMNYPKLALTLPTPPEDTSDGKVILYIHYARARDEFSSYVATTNWTCAQCDSVNTETRSKCKVCGQKSKKKGPLARIVPTGESDMGSDPSQILVVFPLQDSLDEETLAREMRRLEIDISAQSEHLRAETSKLKSTAVIRNNTNQGARPGSLHRVFIVRDKKTNQSLKFGFLEFWTLEDSVAAVAKFQFLRTFCILGGPVTVSAIHLGVFIPDLQQPVSKTDNFSFHPIFNPALGVQYWDLDAYASAFVATSSPPLSDSARNAEEGLTTSKKVKKRKADIGQVTAAKKSTPVMLGQMAMWQQKHAELRGKSGRSATTKRETASPNVPSILGSTVPAPSVLGERAPLKISMSVSTKELAASNKVSTGKLESDVPSVDTVTELSREEERPQLSSEVSYADHEKICCLLCMMKYKSVDDLAIHSKSRNHRSTMLDEAKVTAALARVAARDKRLKSKIELNAETSAPLYRDRAKERREVYNQPEKPTGPKDNSNASKTKPVAPAAPALEKLAIPSRGLSMLAKMGWTEGQGLGANGGGRVEAIQTNAYQAGVGLGAEGSNLGDAVMLAERRSKTERGDYLSAAQEKARERYNRLG